MLVGGQGAGGCAAAGAEVWVGLGAFDVRRGFDADFFLGAIGELL